MNDVTLSVSDFVALLNQTLEYAYPSVVIVGEIANYRVSKGKWVYFDLKDDYSSVKFFGTVYQLPGPLEDGLMLQVRGVPRLHQQFGFSVNVQFMQPVGEGSLKKAAALLETQLTAEGLFDPARKRTLLYPPRRIGLVTSGESAAYRDFTKILNERWGGVEIVLADVQVQGEQAPVQIVRALEYLNTHESDLDVIIVTRGGGSADDLAAFSTEQVTRAVAGSRVPTLVAIGHEVDISLAELAADQRASTPSNAAELLVPDKKAELRSLLDKQSLLRDYTLRIRDSQQQSLQEAALELSASLVERLQRADQRLSDTKQLLAVLSPRAVLRRGYALVRSGGKVVRTASHIKPGQHIAIELHDGNITAEVQ